MNLQFVPAGEIDLEILFDLNRSLIEQYEDPSSIDFSEVLSWVRRKLAKKLSEYRTVMLDGIKVGYFRLCDGEDNSLEIDDLYVLTPYQGQGIGSEIVQHCIDESERLQRPLMLYVFSANTGAVRLYERMGFSVSQTVSETRHIMKRNPESPELLKLSDEALLQALSLRLKSKLDTIDLAWDELIGWSRGTYRTFHLLVLFDEMIRRKDFWEYFSHIGYHLLHSVCSAFRELGAYEFALLFEDFGRRNALDWQELVPEKLALLSYEEEEALTERLLHLSANEFTSAYLNLDTQKPLRTMLASYARAHVAELL